MTNSRRDLVATAISGLLPMIAIEVGDFPTDEERRRCVDTIVMADSLVTGGPPRKGSLVEAAKAIYWLSRVPPGPVVFGQHWVDGGGHTAGPDCPFGCSR